MWTRWLVILLSICAGTTLHAQQRRVPVPGARAEGTAVPRLLIGLDATPKATSNYRSGDFTESIRLMRTTGANHFHYTKHWTSLEPKPGVYDLEDIRARLDDSSPLPLAFNLKLVDAGVRNMPDEYRALAWDSPAMIDHIGGVVTQLAPIFRNRVWSYAIGNEIDMYFGSRPGEIAAYARLLDQVKRRVKALHPGVLFTTSFQFGAASQLRSLYAPIVSVLDDVAFTYYPLGANYSVRPESAIVGDLQVMIAAARPLPVFLQEVGYPSAPILGGSPERQRDFIRFAFDAIRAAGTSRVLAATYLFQADLPEWLVDELVKQYGDSSATFRAYLTTLGLRDERDRPKPGWDEFVRQAQLVGPKR